MENARDFGVSCVCGARPAGESHHFFLLLSEMGKWVMQGKAGLRGGDGRRC